MKGLPWNLHATHIYKKIPRQIDIALGFYDLLEFKRVELLSTSVETRQSSC